MTTATSLRLALAAASAAALGIAAGAVAQGETVRIETEVIMRQTAPTFHGKVKADNENCVEDRKVKLFRKESANSGDRDRLGSTHAADNGRWKIPFDKVTSGIYYAVAPKVVEGTAGTIYKCLKDKSVEVPIQ